MKKSEKLEVEKFQKVCQVKSRKVKMKKLSSYPIQVMKLTQKSDMLQVGQNGRIKYIRKKGNQQTENNPIWKQTQTKLFKLLKTLKTFRTKSFQGNQKNFWVNQSLHKCEYQWMKSKQKNQFHEISVKSFIKVKIREIEVWKVEVGKFGSCKVHLQLDRESWLPWSR